MAKRHSEWGPVHNRRLWYILIVASVAYMCSHSYLFSATATPAFDLLVSYVAAVCVARTRFDWGRFLLERLIVTVAIVLACTVMAFAYFVFDLSYLYGLQWMYLLIICFFYIFVRAADMCTNQGRYVDYMFPLAAVGTLAFCMNFVAYGEPYTFVAALLFVLSVAALVAASQVIHWWALLVFYVVWAAALLIGYTVNRGMDKDYRVSLSYYFSQTPLLSR